MNKIILSAVIATMLSAPLAWADSHHNVKVQPAKIIITQPVQHVIKNHVTKNHLVKNKVAKKSIAHRTIRNEPVNYHHQSQNRSHTGKFISNIAGLVLVIK